MCCQNDPYLLSARVALAQLKQVTAPQRRHSFVDVVPGVWEHNIILMETPALPDTTWLIRGSVPIWTEARASLTAHETVQHTTANHRYTDWSLEPLGFLLVFLFVCFVFLLLLSWLQKPLCPWFNLSGLQGSNKVMDSRIASTRRTSYKEAWTTTL